MNQATKPRPGTVKALALAVRSAIAEVQTAARAEDERTSNLEVQPSAELDEAVDEVIANAKALEVLEPPKVELPAVDLSTIVQFVAVKNKIGRYRLVSPKIRQFIHDSMDVGVVEDKMLETVHDTQEQKDARLRISLLDLERMFACFSDYSEVEEDDVKTSDSGLTWPEYKTFLDDLRTRRDQWLEMRRAEAQAKYDAAMAKFKTGVVDYNAALVGLQTVASKYLQAETVPYVFDLGGHKVAGKIKNVRECEHPMVGKWIEIRFDIHTHNGIGLSHNVHVHKIMKFDEDAPLASFGLIRADEVNPSLLLQLIARGKKYLELNSKPAYVLSTGNVVRKEGRDVYTFNAHGRAMIDTIGMRQMDANYSDYFHVDSEHTDPEDYIPMENVNDYIHLSCSPYLYGFSFKSKIWGQLDIDQITAIQFRDDVFDKLVLENATKRMIFAQVTDTGDTDNDLIAGKGAGCIALLEGPPGVGKTLTAEAAAETLKRPIYYVSVGELGTDASTLEHNLKNILEIVKRWNAVLLLDEGDIFLERRDNHDLERNALVAVFLRLLEYFQGIMFLTTNRADNLDPAFESRITVCIHYKDLDFYSRKQIWTNLLNAAKIKGIADGDIDLLATSVLNGRQIKQVIKSAGALARFDGRNVNVDDFQAVIQQKEDFKKAAVYKLGTGLADSHNVEKQGWFRRAVSYLKTGW